MNNQQKYKYTIPRNAKARFELFGLTAPRALKFLPFVGIAIIAWMLLSGPPKLVIPLVIVGTSFLAITQEIDGETLMEVAENWFKDLFRPTVHLWEEVDHARIYQRTDSIREEK